MGRVMKMMVDGGRIDAAVVSVLDHVIDLMVMSDHGVGPRVLKIRSGHLVELLGRRDVGGGIRRLTLYVYGREAEANVRRRRGHLKGNSFMRFMRDARSVLFPTIWWC